MLDQGHRTLDERHLPLPYDRRALASADARSLDPGKSERAATGIPVIPSFDGFRAFAILGVVTIHILLASGVVARAGDSALGQLIWGTVGQAVDTLFIISGFVVFLPTVVRGEFGSVGSYAIRRAARIMPAYWIAVALLLLALTLVKPGGVPYPSAGNVAVHLAFLQTPTVLVQSFGDSSYGYGFNVDIPLWTLSVEMAFYLVLPFIAGAYLRRPLLGLAICAAVAIGWRELFAHLGSVGDFFGLSVDSSRLLANRFASDDQLPFWAFSFGLGMTGAWAYVRIREGMPPDRLRRIASRAQIAALAALAVFVYMAGHYAKTVAPPFTATAARQTILIGLGYSAAMASFMLATALSPGRRQLPWSAGLSRRLGDISYGVYLSHFAIAAFVGELLSPINDGSVGAFALWSAIVFPLALVYGYLSARYVEIPIRIWARAHGRRAEAPTEPATGR